MTGGAMKTYIHRADQTRLSRLAPCPGRRPIAPLSCSGAEPPDFPLAMIIGYPPLVVDIIPNENDDDHVLAVYKTEGHWGAVAKSNFTGLRYREPVYRSLRELVLSYFEDFFNSIGEKTLRAYTRPLDLRMFDSLDWMVRDEALDAIGEKLDEIRKFKVLTPSMIRNLSFADRQSVQAGLLGARKDGLFKPSKNR